MCICVCVCTCIYVYMCICIRISVYMYICTGPRHASASVLLKTRILKIGPSANVFSLVIQFQYNRTCAGLLMPWGLHSTLLAAGSNSLDLRMLYGTPRACRYTTCHEMCCACIVIQSGAVQVRTRLDLADWCFALCSAIFWSHLCADLVSPPPDSNATTEYSVLCLSGPYLSRFAWNS